MARLTAPRIIAVLIIGFILIWFLILGVSITEVPKIEIRHRTDTSDSYFHDASLKLDFYENHHRRYFIMNYYKLSDTFDLVLRMNCKNGKKLTASQLKNIKLQVSDSKSKAFQEKLPQFTSLMTEQDSLEYCSIIIYRELPINSTNLSLKFLYTDELYKTSTYEAFDVTVRKDAKLSIGLFDAFESV
jgi:hypothetical protein